MIYLVKATFDVALDKPCDTCPCILDFSQSSMAASIGSKPVTFRMENGFVVGFQCHSDDFLNEFVTPSRYTQWSPFTIGFWDVGTSYGLPLPLMRLELNNDFPYLFETHAVDLIFWVNTRCHCTFVAVQFGVSCQKELFVGHASV